MLVSGKRYGKGSDNVETWGWLQPVPVLASAEHQYYYEKPEQIIFFYLLWEFDAFCDLLEGFFLPVITNVRNTSYV